MLIKKIPNVQNLCKFIIIVAMRLFPVFRLFAVWINFRFIWVTSLASSFTFKITLGYNGEIKTQNCACKKCLNSVAYYILQSLIWYWMLQRILSSFKENFNFDLRYPNFLWTRLYFIHPLVLNIEWTKFQPHKESISIWIWVFELIRT